MPPPTPLEALGLPGPLLTCCAHHIARSPTAAVTSSSYCVFFCLLLLALPSPAAACGLVVVVAVLAWAMAVAVAS